MQYVFVQFLYMSIFDRKTANFDRKICKFWQLFSIFGTGETCQKTSFDRSKIFFDSYSTCQKTVLTGLNLSKIKFWQLSTCQNKVLTALNLSKIKFTFFDTILTCQNKDLTPFWPVKIWFLTGQKLSKYFFKNFDRSRHCQNLNFDRKCIFKLNLNSNSRTFYNN